MGACASVQKSMRGETTTVPAPEPPREEETSAATAVGKADGGDVNQHNAAKVEAPKEQAEEVVTHKSDTEAEPAPLVVVAAAALEEEKRTPAAEQKE